MADHIDHVAKLVGVHHVGIGSDADLHGYDDMQPDEYALLKGSYKGSYAFRDKIYIDGFDHPLKTFDLTEELIRRHYSNDNIQIGRAHAGTLITNAQLQCRLLLNKKKNICHNH